MKYAYILQINLFEDLISHKNNFFRKNLFVNFQDLSKFFHNLKRIILPSHNFLEIQQK